MKNKLKNIFLFSLVYSFTINLYGFGGRQELEEDLLEDVNFVAEKCINFYTDLVSPAGPEVYYETRERTKDILERNVTFANVLGDCLEEMKADPQLVPLLKKTPEEIKSSVADIGSDIFSSQGTGHLDYTEDSKNALCKRIDVMCSYDVKKYKYRHHRKRIKYNLAPMLCEAAPGSHKFREKRELISVHQLNSKCVQSENGIDWFKPTFPYKPRWASITSELDSVIDTDNRFEPYRPWRRCKDDFEKYDPNFVKLGATKKINKAIEFDVVLNYELNYSCNDDYLKNYRFVNFTSRRVTAGVKGNKEGWKEEHKGYVKLYYSCNQEIPDDYEFEELLNGSTSINLARGWNTKASFFKCDTSGDNDREVASSGDSSESSSEEVSSEESNTTDSAESTESSTTENESTSENLETSVFANYDYSNYYKTDFDRKGPGDGATDYCGRKVGSLSEFVEQTKSMLSLDPEMDEEDKEQFLESRVTGYQRSLQTIRGYESMINKYTLLAVQYPSGSQENMRYMTLLESTKVQLNIFIGQLQSDIISDRDSDEARKASRDVYNTDCLKLTKFPDASILYGYNTFLSQSKSIQDKIALADAKGKDVRQIISNFKRVNEDVSERMLLHENSVPKTGQISQYYIDRIGNELNEAKTKFSNMHGQLDTLLQEGI